MSDQHSVSSSSLESSSLESSNQSGRGASEENGVSRNEVKRVQELAKSETNKIRLWRLIVILALMIAGSTVTAFTFIFLDGEENEDYQSSFTLFSNTIRDITTFRSNSIFESMQSLSETFTAYEQTSNDTFPFVTLPNFEVSGSHARVQSRLEGINYCPIVPGEMKESWEEYSQNNFDEWMEESKQVRINLSKNIIQPTDFLDAPISPVITDLGPSGLVPAPSGRETYSPVWMVSPPPFAPAFVNLDLLPTSPQFTAMESLRDSVFGPLISVVQNVGTGLTEETHNQFHDQFVERSANETTSERPHAIFFTPIFTELGDVNSDVAGYFSSIVAFDAYLGDLLPDGIDGIYAVLQNSCNQSFTYELTGGKAKFMGPNDLHDTKYNDERITVDFSSYADPEKAKETPGHCFYTISLYPSDRFAQTFSTNVPVIFTSVVAATFAFMIVVFFIYDRFVDRRNTKVIEAAARSSTIVSSLFPSNVRDRLYAQADETQQFVGTRSKIKSFLHDGEQGADLQDELINEGVTVFKSKPIAELFPATTIMFGDIAGFTAWSSSREPAQVFMLLETLYHSFDEIARKRRVFKVETVGDCYVAAAGLPDPRKDHAVVMARFARDCMAKMNALTKKLEVSLGPDTADLSMRIGLHSGPVTAGVLRGERSRFQLFGDTMNTASRMESNGTRGRIQISQETADLLVAAGKDGWFVRREDKVVAKGKGEMTTYWLNTSEGSKRTGSVHSGSAESSTGEDLSAQCTEELGGIHSSLTSSKIARLVEWNVDVLTRVLKQISAKNKLMSSPMEISKSSMGWARDVSEGNTVLDEVKETIALPPFHSKMAHIQEIADQVDLDFEVKAQLHEFVSNVAAMYHDNPFHNFEHASHVTMSVVKLLSRIVAPVDVVEEQGGVSKKGRSMASQLHDHTYGITSDPLTQFACIISALIHDVDHPGVPNSQLIKENAKVAAFYKNKSVAEQNSVDLAWDLLQDDSFASLRSAIHQTKENRVRFRQLVVNSVMATDIMDKDLKALRNGRWERAFSEMSREHNEQDTVNRKATIVIEHLIQASDVAHTMQHWHIYRKWNERLFFEMYKAFAEGRAETNPSENWYQGEIGFFDFYIIPLAKKLKECGVFGVSSDEYLNYAVKNRDEWESRGQEIVQEMAEKVHMTYD